MRVAALTTDVQGRAMRAEDRGSSRMPARGESKTGIAPRSFAADGRVVNVSETCASWAARSRDRRGGYAHPVKLTP